MVPETPLDIWTAPFLGGAPAGVIYSKKEGRIFKGLRYSRKLWGRPQRFGSQLQTRGAALRSILSGPRWRISRPWSTLISTPQFAGCKLIFQRLRIVLCDMRSRSCSEHFGFADTSMCTGQRALSQGRKTIRAPQVSSHCLHGSIVQHLADVFNKHSSCGRSRYRSLQKVRISKAANGPPRSCSMRFTWQLFCESTFAHCTRHCKVKSS